MIADESVAQIEKRITVNYDSPKPPTDKFEELKREHDDLFTFLGEIRVPLPAKKTVDAVCLDLAATAISQHWTEQEITDLLCWYRDCLIAYAMKRGEVICGYEDEDYFARVIALAGERIEERTDLEKIEVSQLLHETKRRDAVLESVRRHLGLNLERVTQYGKGEAIFTATLEDGSTALIGGAEQFLNARRWQQLAVEFNHRVMKPLKRQKFHQLLNLMLANVVEVIEDEDCSFVAELRHYLVTYADQRAYTCGDEYYRPQDLAEWIKHGDPFFKDDRLHVNLHELRLWLNSTYKYRKPIQLVGALLRTIGFENKQIGARSGKRVVGRKYWLIDRERLDEPCGEVIGEDTR